MGPLAASPPLVAILCALIEDRVGLHYGHADQEVMIDKVSERAMEAGFDSLLDYYYFLRYDPSGEEELDRLIEALVVNETYFFREYEQLKVVIERFIEPAVMAGRRPRIWSAACATGEEPLTLALMLDERNLLAKVDLLATDISQRALERAKSGRFGRRSVRSVPDPVAAQRWLREEPNGVITVAPDLLRAITWRRLNLLDFETLRGLGAFDVILCRNVLIYFSDETAARIVSALADRLKPDAALFVSVTESLLRFGSKLSCEESDRVFFYRNAPE